MQNYEGTMVKFGGYGICTHPDRRRRGIATKVARMAMNYLRRNKCDVGFLSVDQNNKKSLRLHAKFGFEMLPKPFSWTNSRGELKQDTGAMVAPINSPELYEHVLAGSEVLYVGKGYW